MSPTAYKYLTDSGVILPDTGDILEEVQTEWRAALGEDLDASPNTPQGMLMAAQAASRRAVVENNVAIANQINPNLAGGVFLDALAALTGLTRRPARPSIIRGAVLTGVPGTLISPGARARIGETGAIFQLISAVVLSTGGTGEGDFQAVETGAVTCGIGELNTPVAGGILGWETVTNPLPAIVGDSAQSDASLRALRRRTLALIGRSTQEAVAARLYALPGVRALVIRENVTSTPVVIDGIALSPHSIWVCIEGGADSDVALALLHAKSAGCDWNGTTVVPVREPTSGQSYPVRFDRPEVIYIKCRATVARSASSANLADVVPAVIVAYAEGTAPFGEPGFRLGNDISPFEISSALTKGVPGIRVDKIEIAINTGAYPVCPTVLPVAINQSPAITVSLIEVVVVPD